MRKTLALLGLGAMMFAMVPAAQAARGSSNWGADGRYQVDETGAGSNAGSVEIRAGGFNGIILGSSYDGDTGYGYYTGTDPFEAGTGYMDVTDHALRAPAYTHPCPSEYACSYATDSSGDVTDPQTDPGNANGFSGGIDDVGEWNIPLVDDMLSKMSDSNSATEYVHETLDILFGLAPNAGGTGKGIIDQTLDQDLADYTGDISSCVWGGSGSLACPGALGSYAGEGKLVRLIQGFGIEKNDLSKSTMGYLSGNTGTDATYLEQLVITAVKDVVGDDGIFGSYTQYFGMDGSVKPDCGALCATTAITVGHDDVANGVNGEIDGHP